MKIQTESEEAPDNPESAHENNSSASKPELLLASPRQNGHCVASNGESPPTESENTVDDLSEIHSKISKGQDSTPPLGPSPANQPGTSRAAETGASCGIYYGIKSYLHHFYAPPDREVIKSGDYAQGDDFRYAAEPRRKSCWVRAGLWVGINLIMLGGIAMLVGYLTPPRQAIVGQFQEFTVLDRWAVNFNYHLMMCQLVGLLTFSIGAVIVVCSLLVANCQPPTPPPAYLVMGAYLPTPTSSTKVGIHCIPLSGTVKGVQPQFIRSQLY